MKSEKTIQTPLPIKSIAEDLQIDPSSIEQTSQKDPQSFYLHLAKLKSQKSWQSESVSKLQQSISDLEKSEKQDYSDYYYLTARLIAANGESEVLKTMLKQSGLSDEDSAERIKTLEDSEDVQKMKAALADFDEKNQKSQSKILGKITEIFEKLNPQNPQPNQQKPTLELTAEQKSKLQNQQTKLLEQLKTHGIERTAAAIAALGRNPKDYLRQDQEIQQTDSDLQEANKKLKTLELSLGVSQKDEEKSPSATESIKSRFAAVKEKLTSEIQSSSQKNIQQTPNKEETDNLKQTNLLLASLLSERSGDSKENSERVNEIISLCEDAAESAVKTGFSLSSSQPANEELKQTWVGLRLMEELTRKDEVLRGLGGQSNGILQDTVEKLKQDRLDSNKSDFTPSDSPYPQTITGNRRLQRSLSVQKGSFEDIAANRHFEDFQKIKNVVAEDKKSKEWSKENVLKFFSESLKDFTSSVASDSSNAVKHFRRHPISSILAAAGVAISFVPGASSAPPLRMPNEDPVSGSGLRATEGSSFTTDLASPIFNSMAIPTSDYVTTAGMAVASKDRTTSFFKPDGNTLLKIPTETTSQAFLNDLSKASIGDYGAVLSPNQNSVSYFGCYVSHTDSAKIKIFADGATSEITASSLPLDQSKGAITKITAFGANQKKYALVWQGDSIDDNNEPKIFEITSNQQSNSLKEVSNDKCQEFLNDSEGRKAFEAARWTKSITQGLTTTWVLPAGDDVYILSASSSQFGKSGIVKVTQEEYQKKIKPFSPSLQKTLNSYPAFVNSTKITFGPSSAISQVINTIPVPKRFNEICQAITSSTSKIDQAITSSTSDKVSDPATSTIEVPKQTSPQNPENNGQTSSQVGQTQQDTPKKPDDTTVANTIPDQRGSDQPSTPVPQTSKLATNCNTCLEQLGIKSSDDRDKISNFIAENSEKIAKECGVSVKEFEGCFDYQASSSVLESRETSSKTLEAFTTYIMTSSTSNPATTSKLPDVITTIATSLSNPATTSKLPDVITTIATSLILSVAKNATSSADARSTSTSKALPFLKSTPAPNQNEGQPPQTVPASSSANGEAQNQGSTTNSPTPTPAPNQNDGQPLQTVPASGSLNKATSSAENNGVNKEAIGGSVAAVAAILAIIVAFIFNRRSRLRTDFSVRSPEIRNVRIEERSAGEEGSLEAQGGAETPRRSVDSNSPEERAVGVAVEDSISPSGQVSPAAQREAETPRRSVDSNSPAEIKEAGDKGSLAAGGAGDQVLPAAAGGLWSYKNVSRVEEESLISLAKGRALFNPELSTTKHKKEGSGKIGAKSNSEEENSSSEEENSSSESEKQNLPPLHLSARKSNTALGGGSSEHEDGSSSDKGELKAENEEDAGDAPIPFESALRAAAESSGSSVRISPRKAESEEAMADNSVLPGRLVASPNKTIGDRASERLDQIDRNDVEQPVTCVATFTPKILAEEPPKNLVEEPPKDNQRSANSSPTTPVETTSSIRHPGSLPEEGSPIASSPVKTAPTIPHRESPSRRSLLPGIDETTNPADNARRPADLGPQDQEATRQPGESEAPGTSPRRNERTAHPETAASLIGSGPRKSGGGRGKSLGGEAR